MSGWESTPAKERRRKIEQRKALWSPELQERVNQQWSQLFQEIDASLDLYPGSEKAQALAERWNALVPEFTGGDPEIYEGVSKRRTPTATTGQRIGTRQ